MRIHSGYIGKVTIHVPWTALLRDSCKVEIRGLFISVVPQPFASDGAGEEERVVSTLCQLSVRVCAIASSMTDSLFFSMTTRYVWTVPIIGGGGSVCVCVYVCVMEMALVYGLSSCGIRHTWVEVQALLFPIWLIV